MSDLEKMSREEVLELWNKAGVFDQIYYTQEEKDVDVDTMVREAHRLLEKELDSYEIKEMTESIFLKISLILEKYCS